MVDFHACLHNCALLGMWENENFCNETKRINDLPKKKSTVRNNKLCVR